MFSLYVIVHSSYVSSQNVGSDIQLCILQIKEYAKEKKLILMFPSVPLLSFSSRSARAALCTVHPGIAAGSTASPQ